jgi:hypothetical protein
MSKNYIKIEMDESLPYISMEYEDLDSFKDLVFFVMSKTGSDLFCKTIEHELLINNKHEELKILDFINAILQSDEILLNSEETNLMNPSSFS